MSRRSWTPICQECFEEIDATDAGEQQRIAVAENAVKISLISLSQLLLIKDYENFDIVDEDYQVVNNAIALKTVDELIEGAKQTRSEVKIAQQNVSISEKDLQIAKGANLPTLNAFFGYNSRYTNATSFTQDLDPDNPFITQEIGREINTIGSKANDSELQKIIVQMKDELEKIKEQLHNIA